MQQKEETVCDQMQFHLPLFSSVGDFEETPLC